MYIFLIILILLTVFLFTNVVAVTEYNEKKFILEIYLYKLRLFGNKKKKIAKEKADGQNPEKNKLNLDKINLYLDVLKKISDDIKKTFRYFKKKIKASKFFINITFGLPDAAETGIATGMIWAFIGFVYPLVDTIFDVKDPEISVNPKFNCEYFDIEYKGIYKLKIIHIVYSKI